MGTLAEIQASIEKLMCVIDEYKDDDIPPEIIDAFFDFKGDREDKIDRYIGYRDRLKYIIGETKERKNRHAKAYRSAKNLKSVFDDKIKFQMSVDQTGMPFKGREMGTLYLQNNAKKLVTLAPTLDIEVFDVLTDPFYKDICRDYLKQLTFYSLDKAAVKKDLMEGAELPWARLEQSNHIQVKG